MKIKEILEEVIKESDAYPKKNFGQMVGEGFSDFAKEATSSESLCMHLMLGLLFAGMMGKDVTESLAKMKDKSQAMSPVILENMTVFSTPLSMLYWGIEIGKRLEKENQEVNKLEKMFGE